MARQEGGSRSKARRIPARTCCERPHSSYAASLLDVSDRGLRGVLERNSIGLLSRRQGGLDQPSATWLGRYADSEKVRSSGLWNVNHVDDQYDLAFMEILDQLVQEIGRAG
jgi:hypothetical protein